MTHATESMRAVRVSGRRQGGGQAREHRLCGNFPVFSRRSGAKGRNRRA
jgi:hypothetical protein